MFRGPVRPFAATRRPPDHRPLDPDGTALVVVDMQYFDAHRDWGYGRTAQKLGVEGAMEEYFEAIDEITPRIRGLLDRARERGMECIHLRVAEVAPDSRDVGYKQLVRGLVVPPGDKEAEFLAPLTPLPDEIVVSKSSSGVFPATNFDRLLRNMGIDTLVFTGTVTGGCVESAVHDATDLGYRVLLVDDACADTTRAAHRLALARMEGGLVGTTTVARLHADLESMPPGDRRARSGTERVKPYLPDTSAGRADSASPTDHIFPPALTLHPDPGSTVLLIQDFQGLYCDPAMGPGAEIEAAAARAEAAYYYDEVDAALEAASRLLGTCREAGILPIHVRTAGRLPGGRDLCRKLRDVGICVGPGDPEIEPMAPVAPRPGEILLDKPGASAFNGTGLDEILRNLGVRRVILAVCSPDGAVEATLRSATDRGYEAFLVADACAVSHPDLRTRLEGMESGIINVRRVEDLAEMLRG